MNISFEFFPPKTPEQERHLFTVIGALKNFHPAFISVTYGALGSTREKTFFWVKEIKEKYGIKPVAHLTCIAATKNNIAEQLDELQNIGVTDILALRGDPPEGQTDFKPPADGFSLAKDLIVFIKEHKPAFHLGAAGFPEGHPRAPSIGKDIEYLKQKVDAGAEYIISQLFFNNQYFFAFLERCHKAGINVPIIPGIMPISNFKQIKKMTDVCGATIPPKLLNALEKADGDEIAVRRIGIEQAVAQCLELKAAKVPGIHFFVMNQAEPVAEILRSIINN